MGKRGRRRERQVTSPVTAAVGEASAQGMAAGITSEGARRLSPGLVAELTDPVEALFVAALRRSLRVVARLVGATETAAGGDAFVSLDDLGLIRSEWTAAVDGALLPAIAQMFDTGALSAEVALGEASAAVASRTALTEVVHQAGVDYLAQARNRLVGFGDEAWGAARDSLLVGFSAGEDVRALQTRVRAVLDVTEARARMIARTETISAANQGALTEAQALGSFSDAGPRFKGWMATLDARTREAHADADGQVVPVNELFTVGGEALDAPGDPSGSPENVINCRCTLWWPESAEAELELEGRQSPIEEAVEEFETQVAAGDLNEGPHNGSMVALVPTAEDAKRLAMPDGLPFDDLHVTLLFLGEADEWDEARRSALIEDMAELAMDYPVAEGEAFHAAMFNPTGEEPCWVLGIGGDDLAELHDIVAAEVEGAPEQHEPWVAHMTLIYTADTATIADAVERIGPLGFDRLRVAFGEDVRDFALAGSVSAETAGATVVAQNGEVELMPWHIEDENAECAAGQFAVVKDEDSSVAGCHDTREAAEAQLAALYASEADEDVEHFHALMITEGVETLEIPRRLFPQGELTWRDLPLPLMWQREDAHGGMLPGTVQVGQITRIEREGAELHAWGRLDLGGEDGAEFARRLTEGFVRGVSVDGGDIVADDLEFVWPDAAVDEDDEGLATLFAEPEVVIFHNAKILGLTAVAFPAYDGPFIETTEALRARLDVADPVVAAAVGSHSTGASDGAWDAGANEGRLASPMPVERARRMYAWIDDGGVSGGEIAKASCRFPHHEVGSGGDPGVANLRACSAGIAALHGGRGGTTIPAGDRQGVYNHLAHHLRDAGREPPPFRRDVVTAAAYTVTIPDVPPVDWFIEPPAEVLAQGALTVTDEGRVYGLLAPRGVAHIGHSDRIVAPLGNVDYSRFARGECPVDDGSRVVCGNLTMACGHAALSHGAPAAADHYDNSCSVFARVAVGECAAGVWVAGALIPGVDGETVARAMSCQLSGDWRPRRDGKPGRELVAALLVPVPGFPVGRGSPTTRYEAENGVLALVASAMPVRWEAGCDQALDRIAERIASTIHRDRRARVDELFRRVHQEA